jgi:hypothetical protein
MEKRSEVEGRQEEHCSARLLVQFFDKESIRSKLSDIEGSFCFFRPRFGFISSAMLLTYRIEHAVRQLSGIIRYNRTDTHSEGGIKWQLESR